MGKAFLPSDVREATRAVCPAIPNDHLPADQPTDRKGNATSSQSCPENEKSPRGWRVNFFFETGSLRSIPILRYHLLHEKPFKKSVYC